MINGNENEAENKNRSQRYEINKPKPRHGTKSTKYKMSQYNNGYMYLATPKQHLAQLKKVMLIKKACIF